jgi:transposase-like protein
MTTITAEVVEAKRDRRGRRITSAERRKELVSAYRASGLTMEQFARREGINRLTLAKWSSREVQRRGAAPVRFAEVKTNVPAAAGWAFELILPNGWMVRAADAASLAELLSVMGR